MLRFFEQKAFCGCKSQIFVFGYWIAGRGDRAGYPVRRRMRLGDAFHWLGVSLEAILRIRRLRRSVCGAHGCSAPPPYESAWYNMVFNILAKLLIKLTPDIKFNTIFIWEEILNISGNIDSTKNADHISEMQGILEFDGWLKELKVV